ncbi:MAG TPA: L,D-transpeptidase, partial [Thermoanaerobaculia bacterium]|nr:L,D-transpeptidase [Thermoanaerobaculia bacterium]
MPERRREKRPDAPDRRQFPRPPLWLNLLILILGLAGVVFARYHRNRVEVRYEDVLSQQQRTPNDIRAIKEELAQKDLTRQELARELEGRMKFVEQLKSEDFYIAVDTQAKKLRFYYGDSVLREGDITVGDRKDIEGPEGKSWTFIPVKGSFPVESKVVNHSWKVPEWVYIMNGQAAPAKENTVEGGLGKYVIFLPNGYVIHSPPADNSPLKGAKPGSFMASEADLRAIWPRIHK